jgi:site-specific recombinase XerD
MPKLDTSNLEKVANAYRCQLAVPARLRAIIGKAKLVKGLKTGDLTKANMLKLRVLHDFKQTLAAAERKLKGQREDPLMAEALQWREAFAQEAEGVEGADSANYVSTALEARYEELVKAEGQERASAMVKVAAGKETPIVVLIDDWLTERSMKPRQVLDYRRAVTKLTTWLATEGHAQTIEGVTKRIASDYRMAAFVRPGSHPRTANKDLSALSSLWKFAARRALVDANPWQGQSLPKEKGTTEGTQKLPFEDYEVARLLTSNHASPMLRDAVTILALSGMRVEELARMKVADLKDLAGPLPYIALRGTKTQAARRDVPVHQDALPIFLRRLDGKTRDQFVFEELPTPPEGSAMERGQAITKSFGRLRTRLGIGERVEGQRQASKDLHSLRRWHIAKCRDALNSGAQAFTMWTVADNVGHAKGGLGLSMTSRYAGAETLEAKSKAVEAVRLPEAGSWG